MGKKPDVLNTTEYRSLLPLNNILCHTSLMGCSFDIGKSKRQLCFNHRWLCRHHHLIVFSAGHEHSDSQEQQTDGFCSPHHLSMVYAHVHIIYRLYFWIIRSTRLPVQGNADAYLGTLALYRSIFAHMHLDDLNLSCPLRLPNTYNTLCICLSSSG